MLMFLLSAVAFLVLLTVLVFIHELGHFFAARKSGVVVEEFGFGLPPRAKTLFHQKGTRFSLNWIPFGGFVRLKGENAQTEKERNAPGSFSSASYGSRILILCAGVFMNFVFAIFIFVIGFSAGGWIPTYLSMADMRSGAERGEISLQPGVLVDDVLPDGTAKAAGVVAKNIVLKVDGTEVYSPKEVADMQLGKQQITYTIQRSESDTTVTTVTVPVKDGRTGVSLESMARALTATKHSFPTALRLSLREAWVMTEQTVFGIAHLFASLFVRASVPEGITGIVGIAQLTHASVQAGFMVYLRLVALLSLSLAILNILPLPALDGGRLAFVVVEAVRRKPANRKVEVMTNAIGFFFLIGLILVITLHDIIRLIP